MGMQDIVVLVIVGAAALYAVRYMWRALSGAGGACKCGPGQKSCGASGKPGDGSNQPIYRPLVSPDQVGKPLSDQQRRR